MAMVAKRTRIFWVLGCAGVLAFVGVMGACSSKVPEETIGSLQAKVKEHPNDPVLNERLATMLTEAGRGKEAVPYFEAAVALAPSETSARCGLARVLFSQKEALEAQKLLEANLKIRPKDPASNEIMGDILMQ